MTADEGGRDSETPAVKVLMISARADHGGGPEHMFRLSSALSRRFEVYAACPREAPYWERFTSLVGPARLVAIPHRRFSLRSLLDLRRLVVANHIRIVHSHGKGAGLYGRLLSLVTQVPCVHTFHGVHVAEYSAFDRFLYRGLERALSWTTARLIAVSAGEAAIIGQLRLCSRKKLAVIENGVVVPPETVDGASVLAADPLAIVTMTRFNYQKFADLLLPIVEELRARQQAGPGVARFRFTVLGTGEGDATFRAEVSRRGLEPWFDLRGAVDNPGDYLRRAFCYLSTSRWEGLPLGVIEAMSFGLPVVASDVVGNRDLVEHGHNGFLYPLEAPREAAGHLLRLTEDPGLWSAMSAASRGLVVERFGLPAMVSRIEALYEKWGRG
jgi:glycosyltransferase involved in cell wall biosynthesis